MVEIHAQENLDPFRVQVFYSPTFLGGTQLKVTLQFAVYIPIVNGPGISSAVLPILPENS